MVVMSIVMEVYIILITYINVIRTRRMNKRERERKKKKRDH